MPGGATPDVLELRVPKEDDLSGDLRDIAAAIKEVVANANDAMLDLKKEIEARPDGPFDPARPTRIAAMLGSLQDAAHTLSQAGDHISTLTDSKGSVTVALDNFSAMSKDLTNDARPIPQTLVDFTKTSAELRADLARTGRLLDVASPSVERATDGAAQMMDTLKREPWRIVWKSTKQYEDAVSPSPAPSPTPKRSAERHKRTDAG
jgi:methyl-accepting chemotaxis protein